jgi:quercetin dioxygenase-like cupin family protein
MTELVLGNIFIRPNILALKGDKVDGHTHNFDHTTYVVRGSFRITRVRPDGDVKTIEVKSTQDYPFVMIRAQDKHELVALEDNSVFHCIYAHRTPQGDVVQEYNGWSEATK